MSCLFTSCFSQEVLLTPNDTRRVVYQKLSNGIPVLAVEDHFANAGLVARYGVGSLNDPKSHPGLAHFLEHMIFIKNECYDDVDGLLHFVQNHAGFSNAYTDFDQTVYIFNIEPDYLKELVHRVSCSLLSPVFDDTYAEKEINAVNSEWELRKNHNFHVLLDLGLQSFHPDHPITGFRIGNRETLLTQHPLESPSDNLQSFYEEYYGNNTLSLSIFGPFPAEKMLAHVEEYFGHFKHQAKNSTFSPIPLATTQKTQLIRCAISGNRSYDTIVFIPFENSPVSQRDLFTYLSMYLQRKDEGSLFEKLQEESLSIDQGSYLIPLKNNQCVFAVVLSHASPLSLQETKKALEILTEFLADAVKEVDMNFVLAKQNLSKIAWSTSKVKTSVFELAHYLGLLDRRQPRDLLIDPYLTIDAFDTLDFRPIQKQLVATQNWIVAQSVDQLASSDSEKSRFDAQYERYSLAIDHASTGFFKHARKPAYLVKDYNVLPVPSMEKPVSLVSGNDRIKLYGWTDSSYQQPFSMYFMQLKKDFDQVRLVKESIALAVFLAQEASFLDQLSEAGFSFSISPQLTSLELQCSSFRANCLDVYEELINKITGVTLEESFFQQEKQVGIDSYLAMIENGEGAYHRFEELYDNELSLEQQLEIIESLSLKDIQETFNQLFFGGDLTAFVGGNLELSTISSLADHFCKPCTNHAKKPISTKNYSIDTNLGLNKSAHYPNETTRRKVAMLFPFSIDVQDYPSLRAKLLLAENLLSSSFFQSLRTEQQLGYNVRFAGNIDFEKLRAFWKAEIISDRFSVEDLVAAMQYFIDKSPEFIDELETTIFEEAKNAAIQKLLLKPATIKEAYNTFINPILFLPELAINKATAEQLKALTKEELGLFVKQSLSKQCTLSFGAVEVTES